MGGVGRDDRVAPRVNYPSGFTAQYGYNNQGFANQLSDAATSQCVASL